MNKPKDLEYFMELNYNVILKRRDDLFYLFIPELSLIVEGENLSEAYEKLEKEKEAYFKKVVALNAQDTVEEPAPIKLRKELFADFVPFFMKLSIIALIVAVFVMVSLSTANRFATVVKSQIPRQTMVFVAELPGRINDALNNMPAEKKEEIRLELRDAIQQVKPFIDEFRILLEDENTME